MELIRFARIGLGNTLANLYPGRCPGLSHYAPSGLFFPLHRPISRLGKRSTIKFTAVKISENFEFEALFWAKALRLYGDF